MIQGVSKDKKLVEDLMAAGNAFHKLEAFKKNEIKCMCI